MNLYVLFSTVALLVNIFVWVYVFAQQKRDPVNATFLMFSAGNVGWIAMDLLMYLPIIRGHEATVARICSFFWVPCGFWFLLFAYALIGRKLDWKIAVSAVSSAIGVALMVFTDSVIIDFEVASWGIAQIFHSTYHPLIASITAANSIYAVLLIIKKRSRTKTLHEKRSLTLIVWGAAVVMGVVACVNVMLPSLLSIRKFPMFGSSAFTVFIVFVFLAVIRYRFLSISVEKVAEELFDGLHEGVLLADRSGRVQRSNSAARNIFGELPDGRNVSDLFFDYENMDNFSDAAVTLKTQASEDLFFTLSASAIQRAGEPIGKIYIIRNITEQKQAEAVLQRSKEELEREVEERTQQLKHAQRMEAVGTLAGGIAHDFNNVLAVILGFASAAKQEIEGDNPIYDDIEEIIVAGNRGREIVRQLLTVSRKQDTSAFTAVDFSEIVQETAALLRGSLPRHIAMHQNIPEEPIAVQCDTTQITQVIMNLCNNAVYAMKGKDKKELIIGVENVVVDKSLKETTSDLKPGAYARLYVRDTGSGIEKENLSRIFNPFFTTKPQGEGTGLGLATAYVIVQNHDGDILVESEPGAGTVFYIYLPILKEAGELNSLRAQTESSPPPYYSQEFSPRILLVDDEPQVRRMGRRVLTQLGYTVTTAQSGKEALNLLEDKSVDYSLVITDYNMPKMTGLELASNLSDLDNRVPVILMSGYGDKITHEEIEAVGIGIFLQKPANKKQLDEAIRQILKKTPKNPF